MKKLVVSFFILISLSAVAQEEGSGQPAGEGGDTQVGTIPAEGTKPVKPKGRTKPKPTAPPNESSSYIGDADNLDPLNPNRDNLKEDAEPVLEDIKDVLNTTTKKVVKKAEGTKDKAAAGSAVVEASPSDKADVTAENNPLNPPPPETVQTGDENVDKTADKTDKMTPGKKSKKHSKKIKFSGNPDDPDFNLEQRFNNIYKRYNINPTSVDAWAAASGQQTARLYEVQKGDTLWSISKILFGDPNFWPKLWAINKQGILNPHFINPKMKIYFYEGDEQNSPTLTVGEQVPVTEPSAPAAPLGDKAGGDKPAKLVVAEGVDPAIIKKIIIENTPQFVKEIPEVEPELRVPRRRKTHPGQLPASLPVAYNADYFNLRRKNVQIKADLGKPPVSEFYYNNDIVITDIPAITEVELQPSEVQKLRCNTGRLLKDIIYSGNLLDEYDIYEKIEGIDSASGYKYAYRMIGKAKAYHEKFLRVTECKSLISTDMVILPKDKIRELATQKITDTPEIQIIGGPDHKEQRFYATLHYAFVDFGPRAYSVGQEYKTVSEITDLVNGEFKVIEKFGSFGVVVVTTINDQLSLGDKIIPK